MTEHFDSAPVSKGVAISALPADTVLTGLEPRTIRSVRLLDGSVVDLRLSDGTITSRGPSGSTDLDADLAIDATGWRFIPGASEPHAHLDKALTAPRMVNASGNDLISAVAEWRGLSASIDGADIRERASAALHRYITRGITTIRTHVDVLRAGDPLRGVRSLLALRDEVAGRMHLQVCLLSHSEAPSAVIEEAIDLGVDVLGGCPHLSPDPHAETIRLLDLAEKHAIPVDLHTDEQTDAHDVDLIDLAQQVIARQLGQLVTASHCVRLGSLPPERLGPVLDLVHRAGIGIVTLPITNLYLQGWDATHLPPRGLTAVQQILDAGIPLAAGADNLRDPFNPAGRADPFETTSLLMTAGHLRGEDALNAVTTGARDVLGLPPVGATPGCAADFMLVPDVDLGDVLAGATDARVVFHRGRVVAHTAVRRATDLFPTRSPQHPTPIAR